jgi:hypothetical protein
MTVRYFWIGFTFLMGFASCHNEVEPTVNLYQAAPTNSLALLEVNSIPDLVNAYKKDAINQTLRSNVWSHSLQNTVTGLTNVMAEQEWQTFLKNRPVLVSILLTGAQKYGGLLITQNNPNFVKKWQTALSSTYLDSSFSYSGATVTVFSNNQNKKKVYLASYKQYLFISQNKNLIEAGLRQTNSDISLENNIAFKKLLKTHNPKDLASLFVNLAELPAWVKIILPKAKSSFLAKLGAWAEIDLQSKDELLLGSGLISYPQNETFFVPVFKNLKAHESAAPQIIPANFSMWINYNVGNIKDYHMAYQAYLKKQGKFANYQDALAQLPTQTLGQMETWVDNEMGVFSAGRSQGKAEKFAYIRHRGNEKETTKSLDLFKKKALVSGHRGFIIHKLAAKSLLPRLYGPLFQGFTYPYYTVTENYVLFAQSLPSLKAIINDILSQNTLVNQPSYLKFTNQLAGSNHLLVWLANPTVLDLVADVAPNFKDQKKAYADSLANLKWAALQIKASEQGAFLNTVLLQEKPVDEKVNRHWTIQMPQPLNGKPQFLKNHVTGNQDIAITDTKNNLHLLSKEGKLFWSKKIDGPILGSIKQIDVYKNNKLQMVFNTAQKLYVVDRLGRNVKGFPVNLPAAATAPVGVFNYDQSRNYRLVVPTGPELLNYNVVGQPVKGWIFKKAASNIVSEPQHFSVAGRDIIVCLTGNGKLYQLNRRGQERFTVEQKIDELKTSFYLKEGKTLKESELIAGSNSGKMYVINPQGKVDNLYLDRAKPADHLIYFDQRYIFTYDEELIVKDPVQPFTVTFPKAISAKPKALVLKNRFYVGAFSAAAEEIRIYNQQGKMLEGFPVFAQGPFDMGALQANHHLDVVTYTKDGTLICYQVK